MQIAKHKAKTLIGKEYRGTFSYVELEGQLIPVIYTIDDLNDLNTVEYHRILPETLNEWTGFYDYNGDEIYENDRVKSRFGDVFDSIVIWNDEEGRYQIKYLQYTNKENLHLTMRNANDFIIANDLETN